MEIRNCYWKIRLIESNIRAVYRNWTLPLAKHEPLESYEMS